MSSTMQAVVVHKPGGPEVLEWTDNWPKPEPKEGWVLLKVEAFGINYAEISTRRGESGDAVKWPRIIGIEATGIIEAAPGTEFSSSIGSRAVTFMDEMGRDHDGSYAQYTLVRPVNVFIVQQPVEKLSWERLAAAPEAFATVHLACTDGMELTRLAAAAKSSGRVPTLLVRGGTSSIGLGVLDYAKSLGFRILSTTRQKDRLEFLNARGATALLDNGSLSQVVRETVDGGVDAVAECVGTATLVDSLSTLRSGGICCLIGMLGGSWEIPNFSPMYAIPHGAKLTFVHSGYADHESYKAAFAEYLDGAIAGTRELRADKVFVGLKSLPEVHKWSEASKSKGKIVVRVEH